MASSRDDDVEEDEDIHELSAERADDDKTDDDLAEEDDAVDFVE